MKRIIALLLLLSLPAFDFVLNKVERTSLVHANAETRLHYFNKIFNQEKNRKIASAFDESFTKPLKSKIGDFELFILEQVEKGLPKNHKDQATKIANAIIRESNRHNIDPLFVLALIKLESALNPEAKGKHGEVGLMQLMHKTAKWIAQLNKINYSKKYQLLDPELNIRLGVAYLALLHKKFDRIHYSVAAYNMGPKNVKKLLKKKSEPQIYYQKVVKNYKKIYDDLAVREFDLAALEEVTVIVADANTSVQTE